VSIKNFRRVFYTRCIRSDANTRNGVKNTGRRAYQWNGDGGGDVVAGRRANNVINVRFLRVAFNRSFVGRSRTLLIFLLTRRRRRQFVAPVIVIRIIIIRND